MPVKTPTTVPTAEDLDAVSAELAVAEATDGVAVAEFRSAPGAKHWRLNDYVTDQNYESFVHISDVAQPANFSHCGTCLKCGWQSMQADEKQAHDTVVMHMRKHAGRLA